MNHAKHLGGIIYTNRKTRALISNLSSNLRDIGREMKQILIAALSIQTRVIICKIKRN